METVTGGSLAAQIPIVSYLALNETPRLRAHECAQCGAIYLDRRLACARCEARHFRDRDLGSTGTVGSFTIVHRSPARVTLPYVSALVELDGGGIVKANLVGVDPTPESIWLGMRVQLTTFTAGTDDEGTDAVAFAFEPIGDDLA